MADNIRVYIPLDINKEVISLLREIPDGCAELFPFETIDDLERAFL